MHEIECPTAKLLQWGEGLGEDEVGDHAGVVADSLGHDPAVFDLPAAREDVVGVEVLLGCSRVVVLGPRRWNLEPANLVFEPGFLQHGGCSLIQVQVEVASQDERLAILATYKVEDSPRLFDSSRRVDLALALPEAVNIGQHDWLSVLRRKPK